MTREWKLAVKAKLADNKAEKIRPRNIPELCVDLGLNKIDDKGGMYKALDPNGDQVTSPYVDAICEILGIDPPMIAPTDDPYERAMLEIVRPLGPETKERIIAVLKAIAGIGPK